MRPAPVLLALLLCLLLAACYNDNAALLYPAGTTCNTTSVTYSGTVKNIITQNCAISGCHDAATSSGGYNFETYEGLLSSAQNGSLLGSVNHANGFVAMPENAGKLPDCEISQITVWVNDGAPDN